MMASNLVEDLQTFRESSSMSPQDMCRYIVLRAKLDDSYIEETYPEPEKKPGRRGRKPNSDNASQEKEEKTSPEKLQAPEIPKTAASQPKA
jgi:hypothetical protein